MDFTVFLQIVSTTEEAFTLRACKLFLAVSTVGHLRQAVIGYTAKQ